MGNRGENIQLDFHLSQATMQWLLPAHLPVLPPGLELEPFRDTKLQYKYILVNHQSWEKLDVNYVHWAVDGDKYDLFVFEYKTYLKQQKTSILNKEYDNMNVMNKGRRVSWKLTNDVILKIPKFMKYSEQTNIHLQKQPQLLLRLMCVVPINTQVYICKT